MSISTPTERLFTAISHPRRWQLLSLIADHQGSLCVLELEKYLKWDSQQPVLSHHLGILRTAGLIICEKRGLHNYYHLHHEAIHAMQDALKQMLYQESRLELQWKEQL